MSAERLRVLIIGAGLGGLTLASLLRQRGNRFDLKVFERDASAHALQQGYSISLKDPGGLVPLRRLGLHDEVRSYSSVVETFTILTQTGATSRCPRRPGRSHREHRPNTRAPGRRAAGWPGSRRC